jgi:hypothetical protein
MGTMPDWFAKTPEMHAADQYFSLADVNGDEAELIGRYQTALVRLSSNPIDYASDSAALDTEWSTHLGDVNNSLHHHFQGDWIDPGYYANPGGLAGAFGAYWLIGSKTVVETIRGGITIAIHKALGTTAINNLPVNLQPTQSISQLFEVEIVNNINIDGVLELVTSWVCVAPQGSDYFEVAALRGHTVVEFSIGTPKPFGHSSITGMVDRMIATSGQTSPGSSTR